MSIVAENSNRRESFFKLTAEELKQAYKAGDINASRYILWIVKTHGKAGWKWSFTAREFCSEWEINERTFYRAVSKLRSEGLLNWETEGKITVWYDTVDATNLDTDTGVIGTDTDDRGTDTRVIEAVNDGEEKSQIADQEPIADSFRCLQSNDQISPQRSGVEKSGDSSGEDGGKEDLLEKYDKQLRLYGIYRQVWRGDDLVDNPKIKPVQRALSGVLPDVADRAITAFLKWIRTAKSVTNQYKALEVAIQKSWQPC
jgi:hypothetical protein